MFAVELDVPERLHVAGRDWFRRPEFHVTTFTPGDLAEAFDVDEAALVRVGARHRDELTQRRDIRFDGRVARVHADHGGQTLVAFCDVAGLDDVYERLSAAVGRSLPVPPTHVTLYTSQPEMKGIGLSTAAAVTAHATALPAADAAVLRRLLSR